ncbi:DEAD/DEAH box helicase [Mycolicibacterium elephantis]|uniref:DEAD/DEAH box helicase n=1 Tax=Mycolicibacterium elephantis TaxID=81858 RepID=UPI003A83B88D
MAFVGRDKAKSRPATILDLYNELPRTKQAVKNLWLHQGQLLNAYTDEFEDVNDLALELPTGTGKTLPGLIICEWVRRGGGRAAYACPTTQLARQVANVAKNEGVPAVVLVGSHHDWPTLDEARYDGHQAIAITNYNTIFNSSPKLAQPKLIVFDDAHAGEQFVGEQFGIRISRRRHPEAYKTVLEALAPHLSGLLLQRLRDDTPDPGAHQQVRLLTPALDAAVLGGLDSALHTLSKPHNFQFAMIRSGLACAMVYLSYGGIEIRPMIPPTFESPIFAGAQQRIYLSATLGAGGELERAFGREDIVRVPLSANSPPRSGRRMFVFPDLAEGGEGGELTREIVAMGRKAIVLSQDTVENARAAAATLAAPGMPVFGKDDVEQNLSTFKEAEQGVLGLANRYDGLDLPDDECRVVVLKGLPSAQSLQEKFLAERADSRAALAERVRTRVVQGAGRCTRGPSDYAIVVVTGSDLTRYFSRPEVLGALDPELQAEIDFGWLNSAGKSHTEILDNVRVFLEHEQDWRDGGEPLITEIRHDKQLTPPPGSDALQTSAPLEVLAWELAYQADWVAASQQMEAAAREVGKGGPATRGYRALLLYIAGLWLQHGATGASAKARARQLVRDAEAAADRGVWLREMMSFPGAAEVEQDPADTAAIAAIADRLEKKVKTDKYLASLDQAIDDLSQTEHAAYERGLTTIGNALGARAFKPEKQGRCDSAWLWGNARWLTIEAKSEEGEDKTIPLRDIRQADSHLRLLASDEGVESPPVNSVSVIASSRAAVSPDAAPAAGAQLYLSDLDDLAALAMDAKAAWTELLTTSSGGNAALIRAQVAQTLSEFGCLPTQIIDRLTANPIRPLV